jgi:hypothetical protein
MPRVVRHNLAVTVETQRNAILEFVPATIRLCYDMMAFELRVFTLAT